MSFIVILLEDLMGGAGAAGFGVAFVDDVGVELLSCIGAVLLSLFGVAVTSGMVLSVSGSSKFSCGSPLACRLEILSGLDMFAAVLFVQSLMPLNNRL
jgi:hypothetical protein